MKSAPVRHLVVSKGGSMLVDVPQQKGEIRLIGEICGRRAVLLRNEDGRLILKTAVTEIRVNEPEQESLLSAYTMMEEAIRANGRG